MDAPVQHLTVQEKLLFAQAVYKVGAAAWVQVSKLLAEHPCTRGRPAEYYTPDACETTYVTLMKGIDINVPAPDAAKPQAKVHLQLARTFYFARMQELKDQIATYEQRFTELMNEVNAIKAGEMDSAIHGEIRAALAKKYGKKMVDTWSPLPSEIKEVLVAGPESAKTPEPVPPPAEVVTAKVEEEEKPDETPVEVAAPEEEEEKQEEEVVEPVEDTPAEETPEQSPQEEATAELEEAVPDEEQAEPEKEEDEPVTAEASPEEAAAAEEEPAAEPENEDEPMAEAEAEAETTAEPEETPAEGEDVDMDKEADDDKTPTPEEESSAPTPTAASPKPTTPKPTSRGSSPGSDLSPASDLSPLPPEDNQPAEAPPSSPTPASTRDKKRKATSQARGGPAAKRRGLRGASPAASHEPEESEAEAEAEAEAEEEEETVKEEPEEEDTTRGRRSTRRGKKAESPQKHTSPPPKRGVSVSSTASGTPTVPESRTRRSGRASRGMRDDVVSKSVRAASEATSVKEEHADKEHHVESSDIEEEAPEPEEEKRSTRTSRRKVEKEVATPTEKRGSKRTARTPRPAALESGGDEDTGASPAPTVGPWGTPAPSVGTPAATSGSAAPPPSRGQRNNQKLILSLLDTIQQHKYGPVFQNPVKKSEAPDYYDIIKRPMDLKTIRNRIKDGTITTIDEFERDIRLMFANATVYNARGSQVWEMAKEMRAASEGHIAHYKSMQHHLNR